ncbi:MAG: hypothetical protein U0516_03755 [Candidatus Saccharibacteria bacterium]
MVSKKPTVFHVRGFEPRADLHKALSRLPDLRGGYHLVTPKLTVAEIYSYGWTKNPLNYIRFRTYWRTMPLYLICPPHVVLSDVAWQRVRNTICQEHGGMVNELLIKLSMSQHFVVSEITQYNLANTYL